MPSRLNIFRGVSALIVLCGASWIVAHRPDESAALAAPLPLRPPGEVPSGISAPVAERSVGPPLAQISELLGRLRHLAPADRGGEDEIRGALLSLLSDDNARSVVSALSIKDQQSEFGVAALARWAGTDLPAAAFWLARQPAQSAEQTWVISRLLVQDAIVLEVLCEQLPASSWRESLLESASRAARPESCGTAARLAQRMLPGSDRMRVLQGIADEWILRDAPAALRWIGTEPDAVLRDELILAGATARASTDPVGALEWTRAIASDVTHDRAIGKIVTIWSDYAPERARRFAVQLE